VIAFIYADLITLRSCSSTASTTGTRFALKLARLITCIIVAALAVDGLFSAFDVIPETRRSIEVDHRPRDQLQLHGRAERHTRQRMRQLADTRPR